MNNTYFINSSLTIKSFLFNLSFFNFFTAEKRNVIFIYGHFWKTNSLKAWLCPSVTPFCFFCDETFQSFFSLRDFGHFLHSSFETHRSNVDYPMFSDIVTDLTYFFRSFRKTFGLWPKKQTPLFKKLYEKLCYRDTVYNDVNINVHVNLHGLLAVYFSSC